MIDGHGDDLHRYSGRVLHNFSTNIMSRHDHSGLLAHLTSCAPLISSYPEPEPLSLQRLIAASCGVEAANVTATNGATEAIYLIAHAFRGARSAIVGPTFAEYADACRLHAHSVSFVSSNANIDPTAQLVWLCNPNNPTGTTIDPEAFETMVAARPDTIFIVDQAYQLYSIDPTIPDQIVSRHSNVIILKSLTKQFGIPGLRIGYALSSVQLASKISSVRMPWSVNAIAIEAAKYLIEHNSNYHIDAPAIHSEAVRISDDLRRMGVDVSPTRCNFALCRLPHGEAAALKQWLVDNHGILIRDASNFEGLSPRHFRFAAQEPEANDLLIKAIRQWLTAS